MVKTFNQETCPICGKGEWIPRSVGVHCFTHKRKIHRVPGMHDACCTNCGTRGFLDGQIEENQRLIAAYQKQIRDYISPSEVYSIREKYMLSQAQADRIFQSGVNMFSKWERGESAPTGTAAVILRLALEDDSVMKKLAQRAGETIEEAESTQPEAEWTEPPKATVAQVSGLTHIISRLNKRSHVAVPPWSHFVGRSKDDPPSYSGTSGVPVHALYRKEPPNPQRNQQRAGKRAGVHRA